MLDHGLHEDHSQQQGPALSADDVDQWRCEVQGFFAEVLEELRSLIVSLESEGRSAEEGAMGPHTAAAADRQRAEARSVDASAAGATSSATRGSANHHDRLAELAKRLEERLGQSDSDPGST